MHRGAESSGEGKLPRGGSSQGTPIPPRKLSECGNPQGWKVYAICNCCKEVFEDDLPKEQMTECPNGCGVLLRRKEKR